MKWTQWVGKTLFAHRHIDSINNVQYHMYTYILVSLYEERRVHKSPYISHFLSTYTQSVWEKEHQERTNKENKIESAHSWYATMCND